MSDPLPIATTGTMVLRPALPDDAALLLAWRNDPETRAASHCSDPIGADEHAAWLADTLAARHRRLYVATENGIAVGTIRVDLVHGAYELSWTTAPSARGRGVATRMVRLIGAQLPGIVTAQIKAGNTKSIRVAEAAGFDLERRVGDVMHYRRRAGR